MDIKSPDISIILIGYNDAQRLPRALQSLVNQSHRNIEIIAVDDNSTDDSLAVLNAAAATDPRIRVLTREVNSGGCSAPRNDGLAAARGRFVMFCDSDDEYDRHACRNLLDAVTLLGAVDGDNPADLAVGTAQRIIQSGEHTTRKRWQPDLHAQRRAVTSLSELPELLYDTISVNKIYRREFLREHGISFPPGLLFEDQLFTLEAFLAARRIVVIPEIVYHWHVHRESAEVSITQSRKEVRNLRDRIAINRLMDERLAEYPQLHAAKHVKFLSHEASLYLATIYESDIYESDPESARALGQILREYLRTIPITAFASERVRPGIRVALYFLITDHVESARESLRFEKGGGVIPTVVSGTSWCDPHGLPEALGRPASWWLDIADLHVLEIPFPRRPYLHLWSENPAAAVSTVDFASDLAGSSTELLFIDKKTGLLLTAPVAGTARGAAGTLGALALAQDRGINAGEGGALEVEITAATGVNRSPLRSDFPAEHRFDISHLASSGCATTIDVTITPTGATWVATGNARGAGALARKVRRKKNGSVPTIRAPFLPPTDRPIVMYLPANLPEFDSPLTRFDTQAWIREFGASVFLYLPIAPLIPRPQRARFAYATYSPARLPQVLEVAHMVITDHPEFITDPRAIVFRTDLGAARYLLPPLEVPVISDPSALHSAVKAALQSAVKAAL